MSKPEIHLLSIGEAAAVRGVAVATLRRCHREGRFLPAGRAFEGHRRYARAVSREDAAPAGENLGYARVSSHDQSAQL